MFFRSSLAFLISLVCVSCDFKGSTKLEEPIVEVRNSISPSVPQGLSYKDLTATSVQITWEPSTDNIGIVAYRIYRDENLVGSSSDTFFKDEKLTPSTVYNYRVSAVDTSSIESEKSTALRIKTHSDNEAKTNFGTPRVPASKANFLGELVSEKDTYFMYN